MLISVVFAVLSIVSVLAFAESDISDNAAVGVLSVANSTNNEAALIQAPNKSKDLVKNTTTQLKFQSAEKSGSAFSATWLFVIALFWFVILSNRRGV